jgi:START domain-containing protein
MDSNHISRLKWDKELSDIGHLETIRQDEKLGMLLTVQFAEHTPPVPGVAKREFVYFQWSRRVASKKHKKDGNWEIIARHVDHPKSVSQSSVVHVFFLTLEKGSL